MMLRGGDIWKSDRVLKALSTCSGYDPQHCIIPKITLKWAPFPMYAPQPLTKFIYVT